MAMADYHLCDNCGSKTFYDANLDGYYDRDSTAWLYGAEPYGYRAWALCRKCEATHEIIVRRKEQPNADR